MRVLVTGGAGFIGSHIVDAMLAAEDEVAVLDNLSSGFRNNIPNHVRLYEVDLRDPEATRQALADFRPRVVSHQAAQASVPQSIREPEMDAAVNVLGGLHLLNACVNVNVERVVFASTGGAIYGEVVGEPVTEQSPVAPESPYAIHKLAFEQLLGVFQRHHGLTCTTLRYANVYGPRQNALGEAGVISTFLAKAFAAEPLRINACAETGDSGCLRDYVYVADVARANALALHGKLNTRLLNIGTGTETTTQQLATEIIKLSSSSSNCEFSPPRLGDLKRSVLGVAQMLSLVGEPVSLSEGLSNTAKWYQSQHELAKPAGGQRMGARCA